MSILVNLAAILDAILKKHNMETLGLLYTFP